MTTSVNHAVGTTKLHPQQHVCLARYHSVFFRASGGMTDPVESFITLVKVNNQHATFHPNPGPG